MHGFLREHAPALGTDYVKALKAKSTHDIPIPDFLQPYVETAGLPAAFG